MARRVVQNHTRFNTPPTKPKSEIRKSPVFEIVAEDKKAIVQKFKRELPKISAFSSPTLLSQIRHFLQGDNNYYLGFGGTGDAILLLASCWEDPRAKVIFFANQQPFTRNFFELFNINVYIHDNIIGTPIASQIYDSITKLSTFRQSAHLADGLDYADWRNESKYIHRIKNHAVWKNKLGVSKFNEPVVVIAPSGSHRDVNRQRYLNKEEYKQLVDKYLNRGFRVYATGSTGDLHHFGLINKNNFYWLTADKIYSGDGGQTNNNLRAMLQIINGAEMVISMDTYLKTYSLIAGIPTHVIKTRYNGVYKSLGEDVTDFVFLNPKIWTNIKNITVEDAIS